MVSFVLKGKGKNYKVPLNNKRDIITPFEIGSEQDFGTFYNMYYKRLFRYAYYYVNNRQVAEDLTHDALLYYWENKNKLSADTDSLGYILLTVRNKCLNYLKHLQVETDYSQRYVELHEWEINARIMTLEEDNYSEIFTREIIDLITVSLSKLPQQTKDIFIQNRFKGKSRKEIAQEMGVSLQKIDYHINKANTQLHKDLKDYLPLFVLFFLEIY